MPLATRYALVGVSALALLSAVHWLRGSSIDTTPALTYMLGVLPNAAAAVAIPFVLTGMWAEVARTDDPVSCRRAFYALLVCSTAALVIWEFVQQGSGSLVFDRHDIGATIAGSVAALGLFRVAFAAASADHANAPSPNERKGSQ